MSRLVPAGGSARGGLTQQLVSRGRALDEDCQHPECDRRVYRLDDHDRCLDGHKQRDHPTHDL